MNSYKGITIKKIIESGCGTVFLIRLCCVIWSCTSVLSYSIWKTIWCNKLLPGRHIKNVSVTYLCLVLFNWTVHICVKQHVYIVIFSAKVLSIVNVIVLQYWNGSVSCSHTCIAIYILHIIFDWPFCLCYCSTRYSNRKMDGYLKEQQQGRFFLTYTKASKSS